jgi:conjugal transfer pilus assembly protein TraK
MEGIAEMIPRTFRRNGIYALLLMSSGLVSAQQTATAIFPMAQKASAKLGEPADSCSRQVTSPCGGSTRPAVKKKAARQSAEKPAPYDALAVHPEAAVKDIKAKEIALPGVMTIAGANAHALDFTKAQKLQLIDGSNEVVYLSDTDPNRIQLPFMNPKINGTEEVTIEKGANTNNVYVQFVEGVTRSVQLWIERPGGAGPTYGLKLVPKKIDGQSIIIRDNSLLAGESISAPKGNDYIANTQFLMETVALGAAPQGFSQIELKISPITMNGLVLSAEKMYSSADRDIYIYDVMNPGSKSITVREQEFDGDSVLAISVFPKPVLAGGEHSKVIVIARKQKER